MTSEERHEARYRRRLAERQRRREERSMACGTFEEVFSFQNLYKAGKLCCKGVGWKGSTQRYLGDIISNTAKTRKALLEGKWKTKGFHEFDLIERGKLRHIRSVHISERVVQRCLCDNVLVPVFSAAFIYDNAASLKGKGIDFAMDRMNCHLQRHIRKHGLTGGILVYDVSDYFNSAPHGPIYRENARRITDGRVRAVANGLMEDFGPVGFGLGSQVSQIDALMLPNSLDHFIKEQLHIRGAGRYMDDSYYIDTDKQKLRVVLACIEILCEDLGIEINHRKTRIVKLSRGFRFLKKRFSYSPSGKVIVRPCRDSITRERRKLKAMRRMLDRGEITREQIDVSYQSWRGGMRGLDAHGTVLSMDALYRELFGQENQTGGGSH